MNIKVEMLDELGLTFQVHKDRASLDKSIIPDVNEHLGYVFESVKMIKKELVAEFLICWTPWTLLCYVVQGQGSKNFDRAKLFVISILNLLRNYPKITTTTIAYLRKVAADVIQLFDSWGGLLTPVDYQVFHGLFTRH